MSGLTVVAGGCFAEVLRSGVVVAEAVGITVEIEYDEAVYASVGHRGSDRVVTEAPLPQADTPVGSQRYRCLHLLLRNNLKRRRCCLARQR